MVVPPTHPLPSLTILTTTDRRHPPLPNLFILCRFSIDATTSDTAGAGFLLVEYNIRGLSVAAAPPLLLVLWVALRCYFGGTRVSSAAAPYNPMMNEFKSHYLQYAPLCVCIVFVMLKFNQIIMENCNRLLLFFCPSPANRPVIPHSSQPASQGGWNWRMDQDGIR